MSIVRRRAIITDIDNTLYNFVDYFAPAFRAMVHVLANRTNIPEEEVVRSFKEVYRRFHSLEYPNSVQKLSVLQERYEPKEIEELVHIARVAFGGSYRRRMRPYPTVVDTLHWLRQQGYFLIAYTDGPLRHARTKLQRLGIRKLFDAFVAWVPQPSEAEVESFSPEPEHNWFIDPSGREFKQGRTFSISAADRKPNPAVLHILMEEFDLAPEQCWLVGDSIAKDLMPAREVGMHDVWARYGKEFELRNWQTLVQVSPWHDAVIKVEQSPEVLYVPRHTISSFGELIDIVPEHQLTLF